MKQQLKMSIVTAKASLVFWLLPEAIEKWGKEPTIFRVLFPISTLPSSSFSSSMMDYLRITTCKPLSNVVVLSLSLRYNLIMYDKFTNSSLTCRPYMWCTHTYKQYIDGNYHEAFLTLKTWIIVNKCMLDRLMATCP